MKEAMLELDKNPAGKAVLKNLGADRFIKTTDADYRNLYKMFDKLGINPKVYPID
jgi:ABC-type phosphate/phosphonate transport system substrate-binding protein